MGAARGQPLAGGRCAGAHRTAPAGAGRPPGRRVPGPPLRLQQHRRDGARPRARSFRRSHGAPHGRVVARRHRRAAGARGAAARRRHESRRPSRLGLAVRPVACARRPPGAARCREPRAPRARCVALPAARQAARPEGDRGPGRRLVARHRRPARRRGRACRGHPGAGGWPGSAKAPACPRPCSGAGLPHCPAPARGCSAAACGSGRGTRRPCC